MDTNWTRVLSGYVNKIVSPDGRQTYESKKKLVDTLLELAELKDTDTVIDIGCGWGNFTKICSELVNSVIGIEPNLENLNKAKEHTDSVNVQYVQGSFEQLNCNQKTNKIVSMLTFSSSSVERQRKIVEKCF